MYDSSTYGRKGVIQIANFLLNIGQRVYSQRRRGEETNDC